MASGRMKPLPAPIIDEVSARLNSSFACSLAQGVMDGMSGSTSKVAVSSLSSNNDLAIRDASAGEQHPEQHPGRQDSVLASQ